ncbi:MAG: acetoacetate--CoA ligase [Proteobacteria bacterium]|nr:acetoacetate--CoA ligase [Pseudomonadota bacterium]
MVNLMWSPSKELRDSSLMTAFQKFIESKVLVHFSSYIEFHEWSVKSAPEFWSLLAEFVEIKWKSLPDRALPGSTPMHRMRGVSWFEGGTLNFAENLLPEHSDLPVLKCFYEDMESIELTATQLRNAVSRCADFLKTKNVEPGSTVAGVLSNGPEAVIAMLATASLGAIWSSCSPDFGESGIFDRLSQIQPKVIFVTRQYRYNGKNIQSMEAARRAINRFDRMPEVIVCDQYDRSHDQFWQVCGGFEHLSIGRDQQEFVERKFGDAQYILFSSGTTGLPKCIVHSVGGTLLQHKKELMLHSDIRPGDKLFFFTTCGWMMWNWMVSALSVKASVVLFDGSPSYPNIKMLWNIVSNERVTHFGTSPKFLSSCMSTPNLSDHNWREVFGAMSQLRTVLSTGSPLLPMHYDWIYRFLPNVHLASISGGTDIVSCFMLGNPNLPVYSGEIQCLGLGMAVEAWDENGMRVPSGKGELVCTKPFVSMPVGFWKDSDDIKYKSAYFEHFKLHSGEVWHHGDFIELTPRHGVIVYGRSDATLNPGGVRIGTSEIYRAVETIPEIVDSIAVGKHDLDDERIVLFVKLKTGIMLDDTLRQKIKLTIRAQLTPRHIPSEIVQVNDIPYTRSGKKVEKAVSQAIHQVEIPNLTSLQNPECIQQYRNWKSAYN